MRKTSTPRLLLVFAANAIAVAISWCGSGSWPSAAQATPTSSSSPSTTRRAIVQLAPAGFDPVSFTAVSEDDYWMLGRVRCRTGRCFAILRTRDGGASFERILAPALPRTGVVPTLRFADRRDGFAFVTGVGGIFFATHDGGATWHRLTLRTVLAFATGGGYAHVVTARCSLKGCTRYRFERSPVSTNAWSPAAMPFVPDGAVLDLSAHGSSVWLLGTPAGKGRTRHDVLARSRDRGRTFLTGPGPCFPGLGGALAPTSASVVWAVCPTGLSAGAWRSTDGGLTFAHVTTPPLANSAMLAPASRNVAVLARNGARSRLLRTTNAGVTWTRPTTPGTATFVPWVGFTDSKVGSALVQLVYDPSQRIEVHALWRTKDGGAHWSRVRFG